MAVMSYQDPSSMSQRRMGGASGISAHIPTDAHGRLTMMVDGVNKRGDD